MTEVSPTRTFRQAPRWMSILLIVSLALNLAVIGMAVAAVMHWRMSHGGPGTGFSRFVTTLPSTRQQELSSLVQERDAIRPLRKKARRTRRQARRAFSAEPFDLRKLEQAHTEASNAHIALNKARGEWFVKIAAKLTAEERSAYLEWRRKNHRRGGWRHRERERK